MNTTFQDLKLDTTAPKKEFSQLNLDDFFPKINNKIKIKFNLFQKY